MFKIAEVTWSVEEGAVRCGDRTLTLPPDADSVRFTKRIDTRSFNGLWIDHETAADLSSVLEAYLGVLDASKLERHNRLAYLLRQLHDHTAISALDW